MKKDNEIQRQDSNPQLTNDETITIPLRQLVQKLNKEAKKDKERRTEAKHRSKEQKLKEKEEERGMNRHSIIDSTWL